MKFEIEKFVKYLHKYKDDLPTLYRWDLKIDKLKRLTELKALTEEQAKKIVDLPSYEKELEIKIAVGKSLRDAYGQNKTLFEELSLWVIKDWGGITTAKDEDTIKIVNDFIKARQGKPDFNRIASSSKVGAFLFPDTNVIYDSRVAYTLNWIILSQNAGQKFFPIPEGRNSKMSAFDMNVLIRLKNISVYHPNDIKQLEDKLFIKNLDEKIFIDKKEAYFELNNLVKQINQQLWKGDEYKEQNLHFTEMLLFSIADRGVFMDITQNVIMR